MKYRFKDAGLCKDVRASVSLSCLPFDLPFFTSSLQTVYVVLPKCLPKEIYSNFIREKKNNLTMLLCYFTKT